MLCKKYVFYISIKYYLIHLYYKKITITNMKKLLIYITILAFMSIESYAKSGPYLGYDLVWSNADHTLKNRSGNPDALITPNTVDANFGDGTGYAYAYDGQSADDDGESYGFYIGYKHFLTKKAYISPELFYDKMGISTTDFACGPLIENNYDYTTFCNDRMRINYRYGAKLNYGYEFFNNKLGVFYNIGWAAVDWDHVQPPGLNEFDIGIEDIGADESSLIQGIGLYYNMTDNLYTKFSYDRQKVAIDYYQMGDGLVSEVELNTVKIGLGYIF